jgi:hypothetical protein
MSISHCRWISCACEYLTSNRGKPNSISIHEVEQSVGRGQDVPWRQSPSTNDGDQVRTAAQVDVLRVNVSNHYLEKHRSGILP